MKNQVITSETTIYTIRHLKEFHDFKNYVIAPRAYQVVMQPLKLTQLTPYFPCNPDSVAAALQEMRIRIQKGEKLFFPFGERDTGIFSFCIGEDRPFVLVLPGGGYGDVCTHVEGFNVACRLNELGYNAFVGLYSVEKNARFPQPLHDVAKMLTFIFDHAETFHVCKEGYAICGFSAGGHLAACWGTDKLGYSDYNLPKPAAEFLCYPVITAGEHRHEGSIENILGKENLSNQALCDAVSIEKIVTSNYPNTYLWQCTHDNVVPFENSQMMVESLEKHGVRHIYKPIEGDAHGWGLGIGTPAEGWLEEAVDFWQNK